MRHRDLPWGVSVSIASASHRSCACPRDPLSVENADFFENRDWAGVWVDHSCSVVKRFRYLVDPLFVVCCALYAANRFVIKPHVAWPLFQNWFNDLLLIPCALPPLLLIHRRFGLRSHDAPPSAGEVVYHLAGWSLLFEVIGPRVVPHAVGDIWDVGAYAIGAMLAWIWWNRGTCVKDLCLA